MRNIYFLVCLIGIFLIAGTDAAYANASSIISPSPTITTGIASVTNTTVLVNTTSSIHPQTSSSTIKPTNTVPLPTSSSIAAPTTTTSPPSTRTPIPQKEKGRSFDAGSFFGGIILGIVLTGVLILGYMYWKNKRKSYHSL
ncbi:sialomucin core protein 24 [Exaiptasia diaphana]|uniref:Sialomucin core protein 24 n=1 Tax=Exaiptasia diaphana TaxID=2652724 RepID=A0A913XR00_EXADI|nr:sialomucin core protein 24 [Exaiptasia diaphana]